MIEIFWVSGVYMAVVGIWGICAIIENKRKNRDREAIKQALKDSGYV